MKAWRACAILVGCLFPVHAVLAQAPDPMTPPPPPGYFAFQKVLYQNDGGLPDDRAYFGRLLGNLAAHLTATDGKVEIRVVSFGPGVKLFQMALTDPALAAGIDGLRRRGVRFLVCRNTLRGMGLRPDQLYQVKAADVVPSGVAEIARLQGLGFVYEHP
jgi:intracellular sulfur oxidation DsrE/DsrF family protein